MSQNVTLQVKPQKSWKNLRDFAQYSTRTLKQREKSSYSLFFSHVCFVPKGLFVNICLLNIVSNKGDETSGHF